MRRLLSLTIASALLVVLAACGGGDGDEGGSGGTGGGGGGETAAADCPVDALDDVEGPVEIVMWHTYTGEPAREIVELVDEYNASQDKVTVELENQGVSYEAVQRQFNTAISSGDLPAIAVLEDTQTQFMADSGVIVPAEACAEAAGYDLDRFVPVVREFYSVDGALQPAMSQLSTNVMYYNKDHLSAAGLDPEDPPETLDELMTVSQAIKDAGVSEQPFVMVLQPWFIEHWLTGAGATIVNNDNGRAGLATEATFDNETTLEVYSWLAEMNEKGLLNPVAGTEGQVDHYFAMALGQSSITVETSTAISTINAVLEGTADPAELGLDIGELPPIDINVGVAPYPGVEAAGQTQPGGGAWYITNTTPPEVQAAAWDFITWFNSPETQVAWTQGSAYLPWNTEAVEVPELQEYWANTRPGQWITVAYDEIDSVDPDNPGPLIGPYTETREAIRQSLDQLLLGSGTPEQVVADAQAEIDAAVRSYEEDNF